MGDRSIIRGNVAKASDLRMCSKYRALTSGISLTSPLISSCKDFNQAIGLVIGKGISAGAEAVTISTFVNPEDGSVRGLY